MLRRGKDGEQRDGTPPLQDSRIGQYSGCADKSVFSSRRQTSVGSKNESMEKLGLANARRTSLDCGRGCELDLGADGVRKPRPRIVFLLLLHKIDRNEQMERAWKKSKLVGCVGSAINRLRVDNLLSILGLIILGYANTGLMVLMFLDAEGTGSLFHSKVAPNIAVRQCGERYRGDGGQAFISQYFVSPHDGIPIATHIGCIEPGVEGGQIARGRKPVRAYHPGNGYRAIPNDERRRRLFQDRLRETGVK
ncbi:hypothetical protein BDV93DRAFT_515144 [Ceratobasidium sp. AG-I]|nr:hypothetical protein BDV93DRAFT_515144 [Ceratobasidium sp. AG-I]